MKGLTILAVVLAYGVAPEVMAKDFNAPLHVPASSKIDLTIERSGSGPGTEALAGKTVKFRYRQDITSAKEGYEVHQQLIGVDMPEGLSPVVRMSLEQSAAAARDIRYQADDKLAPVRMIDWDVQVANTIATMSKVAGSSPEAMRAIAATRQQFAAMTPEQGARTLKEQSMVAVAQGLALDLHTPVIIDMQAANPITNAPVKAKLSFTLETMDQAAHSGAIRVTQTLDPESASQSARQMLQAMAARATPGRPAPPLNDLKVENTLDCRAQIDIVSGLAARTECVSTTTAIDQSLRPGTRIDRWVMTQALEH